MPSAFVNIIVKNIGICFKSENIYLTAEIQEPLSTDSQTYETTGSNISITVKHTETNLRKAEDLIRYNWKLAIVELNPETRTIAEENLRTSINHYNAYQLLVPEVIEPLMVKSRF